MSLLPRREDGRIDYKSMWELKLLKGIFLFFAYLLFILYAITGVQSAWQWIQLKYYGGNFTAEEIRPAVERLKDREDPLMLIHLLNKYPAEYNSRLVADLTPLSPQLPAPIFFVIANRYYAADDLDRSYFWTFYGRYRLRYDALRCSYEGGDLLANDFAQIYSRPDLHQGMANLPPEKLNTYLKDVIAFDTRWPPENSPRYFCDYIESFKNRKNIGIVPKKDWSAIRRMLRLAAMAQLDDHEIERLLEEEKAAEDAFNKAGEGE